MAAGAKNIGGGGGGGGGRKQTESMGDLVQAPWSFFSSSERLVKGIFVKIKPIVFHLEILRLLPH